MRGGRAQRILIVDDVTFIRDLIKSFYDDYELELLEAVNGQEAVALARACPPDLILLDIQMPVMNGYEAAAVLKSDAALRDIPILAVTGLELQEVAQRMSGLCDRFLAKPFKKADLIGATLQYLPGMVQKISDPQA
ncbi:MAG: response regulator [Deltaproteobacteria bacterium]|nr:response regulator [Deltaproteobacteria bacterium]